LTPAGSRLETALAAHPREQLTRLPTPMQRLEGLSERTGLDVWLKRDDLTDLALGGDKPRKLEFEIAAARLAGADTLVTCGSSQSNLARLTAAAARHLAMDCTVVLSRDQYEAFQSNLLVVHLLGAEVIMVDTDDHWDLESHAMDACAALRSRGANPHYIPVSGTTPTSCLGYVAGGLEIAEQAKANDLDFDAVYTPFGTGGVFTASMFAFRELGLASRFVGISVNRDVATCQERVLEWWNAVGALLRVDSPLHPAAFELHDDYVGAEYGDPTPACLDAIVSVARSDGVLLDPVYSGKLFAGFFDHVDSGRWAAGTTILLIHTGGVPALFAYAKEIESHLRSPGDIE